MTTHVPLDQLVVHLLALAEAAPGLPPETLARLAALAPTVQPTVTGLLTLTARLQIALSTQPQFQIALRELQLLLPPERHGLNLDQANATLPNDTAAHASGVEVLAQTTVQILQAPQHPPPTLLQWLKGLLRPTQPPQDTQP